MRRLLLVIAVVASSVIATPGPARAATCSQAVQKPFSLDRITMEWGTFLVCGSPVASATFTGQLQNSGGIPFDTRAGTIEIPGGQFYFWMNKTVCPLPGYYRSAIFTVNIVLMNGTVETLLFQDSGPQFVNCIL